jgi:CRP-like cAMP-binding protein
MGEMSTGSELFAWRKAPLFSFCEAGDWENFASLTEKVEVPAATVLWREGESGICLYCVVRGHLEAVKKTPEWGKPIIMAEFRPGATVGAFSAGEEASHSTTLQVVEAAELLSLSSARAVQLQEKFPQTAARLWRGAAHLELCRLRQANQRLVTLF